MTIFLRYGCFICRIPDEWEAPKVALISSVSSHLPSATNTIASVPTASPMTGAVHPSTSPGDRGLYAFVCVCEGG